MELLVGVIVVFLVLKFGGELPNVAKWLRSLVPEPTAEAEIRTLQPTERLLPVDWAEWIRDELEITDPDQLRRLILMTYPPEFRQTAKEFIGGKDASDPTSPVVPDGNS